MITEPRLDVPNYLSLLPLFNDMSGDELVSVAQGCTLRQVARGDMVFRLGQPCEEFHVVVSGQVKLYALSAAGQEKVIELVGPNNTFAEALMFTNRPYILNAQALTDTLLLTVRKAAVLGEIERDTKFALRMLAGISRRMHGLIADVEAYSLHSGMQRVIGFLLRDVDGEDVPASQGNAGPPQVSLTPAGGGLGAARPWGRSEGVVTVSLPVSKATIASRLSLTPEYFSRVLHELEDKGLIEVERRDIHILDREALAHYQ